MVLQRIILVYNNTSPQSSLQARPDLHFINLSHISRLLYDPQDVRKYTTFNYYILPPACLQLTHPPLILYTPHFRVGPSISESVTSHITTAPIEQSHVGFDGLWGQEPESEFTDSSSTLFSLYLSHAEKYDRDQTEGWKAGADGILVFVCRLLITICFTVDGTDCMGRLDYSPPHSPHSSSIVTSLYCQTRAQTPSSSSLKYLANSTAFQTGMPPIPRSTSPPSLPSNHQPLPSG